MIFRAILILVILQMGIYQREATQGWQYKMM